MCLPTPALNQALLTWRARQTPRGFAESDQLTPKILCWTSTANRGTWAENSSSLPATSTSCPRPETGQKITQGWTPHRDRHGLSAPAVLCQPSSPLPARTVLERGDLHGCSPQPPVGDGGWEPLQAWQPPLWVLGGRSWAAPSSQAPRWLLAACASWRKQAP